MASATLPLHATLTKYSSLLLLLGTLFALGFGLQYNERREDIRRLEDRRAVRGIVTQVVGEHCALPEIWVGGARVGGATKATRKLPPGQVCLALDVYVEPNVPIPLEVAAKKDLLGPIAVGDHVYLVEPPRPSAWSPFEARSRRYDWLSASGQMVINTRDKDRLFDPGRESLVFCVGGVLVAALGGWLQFSAARRRGLAAEEAARLQAEEARVQAETTRMQAGAMAGPPAPVARSDAPGADGQG